MQWGLGDFFQGTALDPFKVGGTLTFPLVYGTFINITIKKEGFLCILTFSTCAARCARIFWR